MILEQTTRNDRIRLLTAGIIQSNAFSSAEASVGISLEALLDQKN
jgi:hypothetical protein